MILVATGDENDNADLEETVSFIFSWFNNIEGVFPDKEHD